VPDPVAEAGAAGDQQGAAGLGIHQQLQQGPVSAAAWLNRPELEGDGGGLITVRIERAPGLAVGGGEAAGDPLLQQGEGAGLGRDRFGMELDPA